MPASQQHDHNHCISTAMDTARTLCEQRGLRMTPVRRRVLELVWQNHKPTGAYDLLAQLSEEGFNSAPPTVYRALDFLLELGVVHRISNCILQVVEEHVFLHLRGESGRSPSRFH